MTAQPPQPVTLAAFDTVDAALAEQGFALLDGIVTPAQAARLAACFDTDERFRSTVVMERHNYGRGTYRYFANPLPPVVAGLRQQFYRALAPVANRWAERLGQPADYPGDLDAFLARCHEAGQTQPTPLLLRYGPGDFNCLHQDRYGEIAFPLQVVILLTPPERFEGGELTLVEQRPRQQSRAVVIRPEQGQAVVFPNQYRPAMGARGYHRVAVRHGVSTIHRGQRLTLGLIFHDAA